jgi:alkanesulfonate monooxygenase SsuD/methylene tetrahydromethanopterin reductase-like flavin-dependent oxidoreductase (luciferase family)
MECSTLARMHPGRFRPGIGLGLPYLLGQMGLKPRSQLAAVRECVTAVRRLLAGEELTEETGSFRFREVKLAYPLEDGLPLSIGVIGPKMLQLSGAIADGTIASVLATPEYVRWAREQIAAGAAAAGRQEAAHRLTVFELFAVDRDGKKARDALRPAVALYLAYIATGPSRILVENYGIVPELLDMVERAHALPEAQADDFPSAEAKAASLIAREMPDSWIDDLAVVGDPDQCAAQIRRLLDAGGDSIVLFPTPAERTEEAMRMAAAEVFPRL